MKIAKMFVFSVFVALNVVGCVAEDDGVPGVLEQRDQSLKLVGKNDQMCTYRGTVTCTQSATGNSWQLENYHVAIPVDSNGGCASSYDEYNVQGFGSTEVVCQGVLPAVSSPPEEVEPPSELM